MPCTAGSSLRSDSECKINLGSSCYHSTRPFPRRDLKVHTPWIILSVRWILGVHCSSNATRCDSSPNVSILSSKSQNKTTCSDLKHRGGISRETFWPSVLNWKSAQSSYVDLQKRKSWFIIREVLRWWYDYFSQRIHHKTSLDSEFHGHWNSCLRTRAEERPVCLIGSQPYLWLLSKKFIWYVFLIYTCDLPCKQAEWCRSECRPASSFVQQKHIHHRNGP